VANLLKTLYTKFYHNQPCFREDVQQTFWLTFYEDMLLGSS